VDDSATLRNTLQVLGVLTAAESAFVAVKDGRNPGAYTLWLSHRHNGAEFRRPRGPEAAFKHAAGFPVAVKAESAEAAARQAQL